VTQRILSISGLRGVIGDGLDPSYVVRFAAALGIMAEGGSVVVSRDGRPSGEMIKHAVLAGLTSVGCRVIDAGIASTPTCGVLINHLHAQAGLQITASHNPIQWNGLKPFSSEGSVLDAVAGQKLIDILEADSIPWAEWNYLGSIESHEYSSTPHMEKVLNLVDVPAIQMRKLKVVLDCNHGSGAVLGPRLLEELGCEVHVLGDIPDGQFEHTPEPLKENLAGLCEAVRQHGADAGFAQDPDADRLAIVDNTGRYIGEELTPALCVDHVLSERQKKGVSNGAVVVNGSTSRVTADIAEKQGYQFYRSYVGEAHVVAKMKEVSAIIGGEGNGGVIEPKVGYVRDSFVGMAYILEGLASENRTLADWADAMPQYTIVKDKITCSRDQVAAAFDNLKAAYPDANAQEGDGLRLDWDDRWVQVRASNTEPIIRVIAEAANENSAKNLCKEAKAIVKREVT
jgi:phosphomannomutase